MLHGDIHVRYESCSIYKPGCDIGGHPHLVDVNPNTKTLVMHQRGHEGWAGRGTTHYYPAVYSVYLYEQMELDASNGIVIFKEVAFLTEMHPTRMIALRQTIGHLKGLFDILEEEIQQKKKQPLKVAAVPKEYPREDWQYQVANGDTQLGYQDWVEYQKEMDMDGCSTGNSS